MSELSEQKCPKCGYKIGVPLGGDGTDFKLTDAPCHVLLHPLPGMVWLSQGKPPREVTNRELFILCTHRPRDILPMMAMVLKCNANLPLIDSATN